MTPEEMASCLQRARVARLATLDHLDRPHLVPVVFAADVDHIYSAVDHKPKRTLNLKRLRNIRSHPRVALLVDHYEDDWSELWWVRVDGTARIEESGPERERALRLLEEKYAQYRPKGPRGPVIIITIDRISGWSAGRD